LIYCHAFSLNVIVLPLYVPITGLPAAASFNLTSPVDPDRDPIEYDASLPVIEFIDGIRISHDIVSPAAIVSGNVISKLYTLLVSGRSLPICSISNRSMLVGVISAALTSFVTNRLVNKVIITANAVVIIPKSLIFILFTSLLFTR